MKYVKRIIDVVFSEKAFLTFWTPFLMFDYGATIVANLDHHRPVFMTLSLAALTWTVVFLICDSFEEAIREEAEAEYFLEGYRKGAKDGGDNE